MRKNLICLLVVVCLFLCTLSPAYAAELPPNSSFSVGYASANSPVIESILRNYVKIQKDGTLRLSAPLKVINRIGNENYRKYLAGVETINSMIRTGYLKSDKSLHITPTKKYVASLENCVVEGNTVRLVTQEQDASTYVRSMNFAKGETKIVFTWYGFDLYLDSVLSDQVAAGISISSAVSSLVPVPALALAVAVAISGVAYWVSSSNQGNGTIITIYASLATPWLPPTIVWVGPQPLIA